MGDAATNTAGRDSSFVAASMGLGPMSVSVGMFEGGAVAADATTSCSRHAYYGYER